MSTPITILGTTILWPTTGDTGYGNETTRFAQFTAAGLAPISGLFNSTTGHVGNLALDDFDRITVNGNQVGGVITFNTRTGAVVLLNSDVDTALGYIAGTVNSVSITAGNGISGVVTDASDNAAIALALDNITPWSVTANGSVTGSNLTGNNTGDQTITLTGDVTGSGPGSFATTLSNTAVTAGTYVSATITVDSKGRVTNAIGGGVAAGVASVNTRTGAVVLNSLDVTTALGYTPGTGSVTNVAVTTGNGVSAVVTDPTVNADLSFTLGAITPSSVAAVGSVTGSNLSGTNTGDQTITLTGAVTGTGTGSFATTLATVAAIKGGTGQTAYAIGDLLYASSTTTLAKRASGTVGQVLTMVGGVPAWAAAGGSLNVVITATTTQTAAASNIYLLTNASITTVTLPASPTAGDTIQVKVANGLATNIINPNGNTIEGIAGNMTLDSIYAAPILRFINSSWRLI